MTIQYKNASKILTGTAMTTVLSISTSAIAIIKSVYISNNSNS